MQDKNGKLLSVGAVVSTTGASFGHEDPNSRHSGKITRIYNGNYHDGEKLVEAELCDVEHENSLKGKKEGPHFLSGLKSEEVVLETA